jgi:tetratricopeptide (TPR) repeat protein
MTTPRSSGRWMMEMIVCVSLLGGTAHAQEPLVVAKLYYASAAYEDALKALADVSSSASSLEATEAAAYRAFCLLALGRTDEAKAEVESLVRMDPLYRPSDEQASPRVRSFFDDVRRPLLADAVRQTYASARAAFEREDLQAAAGGFDRVLRLLEDIGEAADPSLADMRTLATGFKDLVGTAIAKAEDEVRKVAEAEAQAAAEAAAAQAAPPEPEPDRLYTDDDPGVVKPEVVSRNVPQWMPPAAVNTRQGFSGVLEVVIDRDGKVEASLMRETVHPLYDPILLRAAKAWRFKPATKDGAPVKYVYRLGIRIGG